MAIYHLHVQPIGRGDGQSAIAAAAYRSTSRMVDRETGEVSDYTRKTRALETGIIAPENAPRWALDRDELWNKVHEKENRKNSQFCWSYDLAIPHEIGNSNCVKKFIHDNFTTKGLICDYAIHKPDRKGDRRNIHAHILVTTRAVTAGGWGNKYRRGENKMNDRKAWLNEVRESWASVCNQELKSYHREQMKDRSFDIAHERKKFYDAHGYWPNKQNSDFYKTPQPDKPEIIKIDHRTLKAQGIDREPQQHQGATATAIERKGKKANRTRILQPDESEITEKLYISKLEHDENIITQQLEIIEAAEHPEKFAQKKKEIARKCKHYETIASIQCTEKYIPEIEKLSGGELARISRARNTLGDRPEIAENHHGKLATYFYEWEAADGKRYPRKEYEKIQSDYVRLWDKKTEQIKLRENELIAETAIINKVKTGNKTLKTKYLPELYNAQKTRPEILEKIQAAGKALFEKAAEFEPVRALRKTLEIAAAARAESERKKQQEQALLRPNPPRTSVYRGR